jgi:leucyl aminopeptidase
MEFSFFNQDPFNQETDALILLITSSEDLGPCFPESLWSNPAFRLQIEMNQFKGKKNEQLLIQALPDIRPKRLLLQGIGDNSPEKDFQTYVEAVVKAVKALPKNVQQLSIKLAHTLDSVQWRTLLLAVGSCNYTFDVYKSKKPDAPTPTPIQKCQFYSEINAENQALQQASALLTGQNLAKDLGNLAPNDCNPAYLQKVMEDIAQAHANIEITVYDEPKLKEMGAGAFVAVSQGSQSDGRIIIAEYKGKASTEGPIALVGKGITFDSGGISIKPSANMDEMKYDMCGAAAVIGVLKAVAELALPIHLVVAVAAAENLPSGNATRPGDIVKSLAGKTIEILNTDAEGRLVLCDAITQVRNQFNPRCLIDVATLTGAVIMALGYEISGLIGTDDKLNQALLAAGKATLDEAWLLPLNETYRKGLESPFADLANISNQKAGTITGGAFLSYFTEGLPWAHLDIAGTASKSGGKNKGATGRPVALLCEYLIQQA